MNKLSIDYNGSKTVTTLNGISYFEGKLKKKYWKDVWILKDKNNDKITRYELKSKLFKRSFRIFLLHQNETIILNYKNKNPHISFTYENSQYLIIWHINYKFPMFKNEDQIASMRITSDDYMWKRFSIITADFINVDFLLQTLYAVILVSQEKKRFRVFRNF